MKTTKIDFFCGFLGAGKTTFLKKMVTEVYRDRKIILLENETGTETVDEEFRKQTGLSVASVGSGCICCGSAGDFEAQLQTILGWQCPDRLLIEPAVMAKLSELLQSVESVQRFFAVDGTDSFQVEHRITVVDARRYASCLRNYGEFYRDQIANADLVVLSHIQEAGAERLQACIDTVGKLNPQAQLLAHPWEELSLQEIIGST